ncbi:hypothetical protein UFOVP1183_16 [uncultured Caudovirales phage]|uniref:Uncharacterized protein n=1 Tax=uncultured Caudovirales phage TaxID=2100421 RepID=A0A6J5R3S9_9CAUD|nr:hypothetical protein UFOVP955_17 [uncultured Caudovirales phage]CAB4185234.1 hypothetical protein UFOVP1120_22 [uncultured Caudovirales phage]CAB4188248.1 hypothetical protein UFOVP1183_16 [uncultured Caudovirales phage]CAB4191524.1 hypothetical protein UFOVP1227_48 [uncultured Caudovirales phage]CAB5229827.1 hypothetical protein UFOVP1571_22 [uncultured Caudovirales phage]
MITDRGIRLGHALGVVLVLGGLVALLSVASAIESVIR